MKKVLIILIFSLPVILYSCSKKTIAPQSFNDNLPTGDTTPVVTSLKPQISGLMNRSFNDWITLHSASDAGQLSQTPGIAVNVGWNALQDYAGAPIKKSIIDTALGFIQSQNKLNPGLNLRLKIRLFCGYDSPKFVFDNTGGPLFHKPGLGYVEIPQSDTLVARWWVPQYMTYFKDLENKLAARYDAVPEIEEITTSACGTFSSENFVHQFAPQSIYDTSAITNIGIFTYNITNALAAGYTNNADIAAQKAGIDAMHAWKYTRVSFVFNQYEYINSNETVTMNTQIAEQIMDYFIQSFGKQAVLGNNGLREDGDPTYLPGGVMYDIYTYMKNYHENKDIPITFQTAIISRVGNLVSTIQSGVQYGAGSVELPEGYGNFLNTAELQDFNNQLRSQSVDN